MNRSYLITFLLSFIFIVLAFLFQDQLSHFRSLGLLGIFLINFFGSATIFVPAPAIASVVAGGVVYGILAVALVAAMGAAGGDMLGFFLGLSGRHVLLKKERIWFRVIRNYFARFGGLLIFVFAFVPNPFFDGIGIVAGALGYSPYRFFGFLFAGRLLRNIFLAYVGYAMGK